ncbi:hypothetical protein, partial [Actinobacillus pleuropneumoniae]
MENMFKIRCILLQICKINLNIPRKDLENMFKIRFIFLWSRYRDYVLLPKDLLAKRLEILQ